MKKYKLTSETKNYLGITLYRIKALRDFANVKKGDLGGWVESEKNLSHDGNCWVSGNARVCGNAQVYGDVQIYGYAQVYENTQVYGDARVYGNALVYGNAYVYENTQVYGDARVFGTSVPGSSYVYIKGNVKINSKVNLKRKFIDDNYCYYTTLLGEFLC